LAIKAGVFVLIRPSVKLKTLFLEVKMKLNEFLTLNSIIDNLTFDDLYSFENNCMDHGAKKTALYIKSCRSGRRFDKSVARHYLSEDFSGV
jgi:hypothetical protein